VGDQHFQKKCVERIEAFRRNGCTILFCSHSLYHVRQLCDVALWLHGGRQQAWGPTERVLGAYESHVREQNQKDDAAAAPAGSPEVLAAAAAPALEAERRGAIVSVDVTGLGAGDPPLLPGPDLQVMVTARLGDAEVPNIGVMLEQAHGVGITVAATHADGAKAVRGADGLWRATVTFPKLPLHSGEYVLSAYLADSQALVIYDEWHQCTRFSWEYPSLVPGLVQLPHHWT
ncbi:MAG: ABC transporter ATP-binding protein, partial [Ramlibacter sp.]